MPSVPNFLPSTSAPLFYNGPWPPGTNLSISIPGLPAVTVDATQMGLCGGMSFLARDIHESGTEQLRNRDSRRIPAALAQHVLGRLIQSFDGAPSWPAGSQTPRRPAAARPADAEPGGSGRRCLAYRMDIATAGSTGLNSPGRTGRAPWEGSWRTGTPRHR